MQEFNTDVLIVGAGPAGLATAIGLAQRGVDFIIVDALAEAQNTSRAAVIHAATLQTMRELGVADQLIAQGIEVPHFRLRDRDAVLVHLDFSKLDSPTPYALMIPQDESEAILIDHLKALGHSVRRPIRISGLARVAGGVRVSGEEADGALAFNAKYIVGADGEHSKVRAAAGIDFPGDTYGSFLLADVKMDWPIPQNEVDLFFSEAGTLVVAPMSGERYRVVAQLPGAPSNPDMSDVQAVIDARGPRQGARVREVLWGSRFQVHHKLADRFRDGPIVLVGDAAHVHSPAGGQGMNLGLRDAAALGAALYEALNAQSDTALDIYAATQREAASTVLKLTDRLTKVATMGNPTIRWMRNRVLWTAMRIPAIRRLATHTLAGY